MTSKKCNETRSDELCVSGRKFQLGSNLTWSNTMSFAQLVQMLSRCKCPFQLHHERKTAAFVINGFSNWKSFLNLQCT